MRTTITIREELLAEAQNLSGKSGFSDAIVTSLEEYVALRKRLALLESCSNKRRRTPGRG